MTLVGPDEPNLESRRAQVTPNEPNLSPDEPRQAPQQQKASTGFDGIRGTLMALTASTGGGIDSILTAWTAFGGMDGILAVSTPIDGVEGILTASMLLGRHFDEMDGILMAF